MRGARPVAGAAVPTNGTPPCRCQLAEVVARKLSAHGLQIAVIAVSLVAASTVVIGAILVADRGVAGPAEVEPPSDPPQGAERPVPPVRLERVVGGLVAPTNMTTGPDGTLIVLDQPGLAYRIDGREKTVFADLRRQVIEVDAQYDERGLLGMAFHPDHPRDRRVFVYYSAELGKGGPKQYDHTNVLSSFTVGENGVVDPETEKRLLTMDWPSSNHNGGTLAFGPDRMLYLTLGDGGNRNDVGVGHPPLGNGQDRETLMGSIIRVDPDGGDPYGIPPDNPFAGEVTGRDEIWAYGLRNAYSFAFDPETGRLFAGDVGQNLMEEVDLIDKGGNYGWNIKEGTLCFNRARAREPLATCSDEGPHGEPLVAPIMTYALPNTAISDRSPVHGLSVIGGRVYRGQALPELQGDYVFGDWTSTFDEPRGKLLLGRERDDAWSLQILPVQGASSDHIGRFVRAFGQDASGEVYVLTSRRPGPSGRTGEVLRIVPATAADR